MLICGGALVFRRHAAPCRRRKKRDSMDCTGNGGQIDTRLVCGFEDAGKTTYILGCVKDDRFYKRGSTLILCFEKGEARYDEDLLAERNASLVCYDGGDVRSFCENAINAHCPDRIYVEMNSGMEELREQFPECMRISFVITLIDWATFQAYYATGLQTIRRMVSESHQVTFRGCPMRRMLEPYSQAFRVMNPKAVYLRQDPMGYHEKAFDLFVPFSLEDAEITICEKNYLPFWLDAFDHPEHYSGKLIRFTDPLEIRRNGADGSLRCGRVVMTCCMADLQFMSFELDAGSGPDTAAERSDGPETGWAELEAAADTVTDLYGRKKLKLIPENIRFVQAPEELRMDSRRRG